MIGKTISHYKILEKLGEGGMGVVYKAEDTKLKRMVALKFLPTSAAQDPVEKTRFIREAQAAAALDHPNIAAVHEIRESDEESFIVMAFVEGVTLKEKIQSRLLSVDESIDIAIQIAQGLKEAHDKGIVHRDIKSSNIMITPSGQVKITDFGLAKFRNEKSFTKPGAQMGTASYMSPEQIQAKSIDHQCDIFSFGVVLYEMLTGDLPFKGENDQAVMFSILYDTPPSITERRPEVPFELEQIVEKALNNDKKERYQRSDEFLEELLEFKNNFSTCKEVGFDKFRAKKKKRITKAKIPIRIAVLPLENLSDDPGQDYFVEGMHEALITDLSKISALRIISRMVNYLHLPLIAAPTHLSVDPYCIATSCPWIK